MILCIFFGLCYRGCYCTKAMAQQRKKHDEAATHRTDPVGNRCQSNLSGIQTLQKWPAVNGEVNQTLQTFSQTREVEVPVVLPFNIIQPFASFGNLYNPKEKLIPFGCGLLLGLPHESGNSINMVAMKPSGPIGTAVAIIYLLVASGQRT